MAAAGADNCDGDARLGSLRDHNDDDGDDDDYGFDPTLHVWHPPPENYVITDDSPDGKSTTRNCCTNFDVEYIFIIRYNFNFFPVYINLDLVTFEQIFC